MARTFKRSPLALAVLVLLAEAPMHPYRMQQLIKERGKDLVINVQRRASLYQTIGQLQRAGFIRVRETARTENRPERTVYELTRTGFTTARGWLRDALASPESEYPIFPAAISFLPLLAPDDAIRQLQTRADALKAKIAELDEMLATPEDVLPRLFLLEEELLRVTMQAEWEWVCGLIDDLRAGRITWTEEWLRDFVSPSTDE